MQGRWDKYQEQETGGLSIEPILVLLDQLFACMLTLERVNIRLRLNVKRTSQATYWKRAGAA